VIGTSATPEDRVGIHARVRAALPWWLRLAPLFLSALLFLSAFFSPLAPLPLVYANLRFGRRWAWAAALTNSAIVARASGVPGAGVYIVAIATVGLALPEMMRRKATLQRAWIWTLGAVSLAALVALAIVARLHSVSVGVELQTQLTRVVEVLIRELPPGATTGGEVVDPETLKTDLREEIPSVIAVFGLLLVWANIALAARFRSAPREEDPIGISIPSIRAWKAPDWLVWPTIASGFLLIFDGGQASIVALNLFKFLMALYAIQGLCVMAFFMEAWNIRAGLRTGINVAVVLLMLPLVLSLGFFDLWFDFRSKFRQS
jgi:hypothetical protein